MPDIPKPMSVQEQAQLFPFFEAGLAWATGTLSFDDIVRRFGKPVSYSSPEDIIVEYTYFLQKNVTVDFRFDKLLLVDGKPSVKTVMIGIDSLTTTDIPKESYEATLNLHRVVRGESIDSVRNERSSYFSPRGVIIGGDPDTVDFVYRQLLPPDSPYDVYVTVTYKGKYGHDGPEFRSLQNPRDLRSIKITRWYLTPEQLEQRYLAKRQKYGMMNLRTGMVCPETGLWESWMQAGIVGKAVVRAGDRFKPYLRLDMPPADVRWMWSGEYRPERLA
ncbi:hypothetical protein G3N58_05830 [Paraburkholderia sp. Ac-20342]|uniref:hypothetical protein n=1 Tax=Paraburkholderia sp. Ac-20342 TaxID=2703889 RepID=UPI0019812172|nr:hypothetical protein [Paraburkholderia sp. Ac-20342]MBN3846352.1 hypothetical protein [Paraburkholderia sp. Ac-20342]